MEVGICGQCGRVVTDEKFVTINNFATEMMGKPIYQHVECAAVRAIVEDTDISAKTLLEVNQWINRMSYDADTTRRQRENARKRRQANKGWRCPPRP